MRHPGQIALLRFPQADLLPGKLRPVLLLAPLPGPYDDWLVCMVSSQLRQAVEGFDEVVTEDAPDFQGSGLKVPSVLRIGRVAVVEGRTLVGATGQISPERLGRVRERLAQWMQADTRSAPGRGR